MLSCTLQIEQEGLTISEQDTSDSDDTFLMNIMELNETLATSPSTDTLLQMKKENESKCIIMHVHPPICYPITKHTSYTHLCLMNNVYIKRHWAY